MRKPTAREQMAYATIAKLEQQRDALLAMLKESLPHIVGMGLKQQAQELIDSIK